jgi:hypothetical protein
MADITRPPALSPQRRHRACPRVIKRARHNSYRVKRASDQQIRYTGPPAIALANLSYPNPAA